MNDISVCVSVCKTKKCLLYLYILLTTVTVPVQDTTALVTLRDKPLGGNDSTPLVHVLCRMHTSQKYLKDLKYLGIVFMYQYLLSVCKTEKCLLYLYILTLLLTTVTVPVQDTTALVTLRDKPLGGNDSTPLVHVLCRMHTCQKYLKDLKYLGIILMYQYLIIFLSKLKDTEVNMVSFQFRIRYMWAGTDNTDPEQALWCQLSITTSAPVPTGSGFLTINCSNNNHYLHGLEGESGQGSTIYPCLYFSKLIIFNLFLNAHFITTGDALRHSDLNNLSLLGAENLRTDTLLLLGFLNFTELGSGTELTTHSHFGPVRTVQLILIFFGQGQDLLKKRQTREPVC